MADSSNGNTTSLNMSSPAGYSGGTIGTRQFDDMTARGISSSISRENFNLTVQSDERMQKFRDAVYKLVSSWTMEDKVAIITEYGDSGFLKKYKKPTEDIVNRVCTESIIIHMDPKDLKQLYNDIMIKEKQLNSKVKMISAKNQRNAKNAKNKTFFNTSTFESAYNNVKYVKNADEMAGGLKNFDPSYKVPAVISGQFGTLRKELASVLKDCFNKNELAAIANSMGIDIPEGTNGKEISKWIINKVCLYVSLVTGHGKKNYANAISNVEPYNNLLKYTSYSYITGEPGLDPSAWADLKREAKLAKMAIKERAKMQKSKKFKGGSKEMRAVTGGKTASSVRKMAKAIRENDTGMLADASYEELVQLAGKYGIDASKFRNKNIGILKAQIYNGMAQEQKRVTKLTNKTKKAESHGWVNTKARDLLDIHKADSSPSGLAKTSDGIPIIHLDKSGSLVESIITTAVPVYLVGQGKGGAQQGYVGSKSEFMESLKKNNKAVYMKMDASVKGRQDLSEAEQDLLDKLLTIPDTPKSGATISKNLQSFIDLKDFVLRYGFDRKLLESIDNDIDSQPESSRGRVKRILYGWLYTYAINSTKVFTYLTKRYNIKYKIKKAGTSIRKLAAAIKSIGKGPGLIKRISSKSKELKTARQEKKKYIESASFDTNKLDEIKTEFPIPKMIWNSEKTDFNPPEVVPVYIMGTFKDRYTKGMGRNVDAAKDYKSEIGEKEPGSGKITLTKDGATILAELSARGYTPTTKTLLKGKGKIGKKYQISTKDLEWAKENGFKFATGGSSFIVGDSLTNRPNPEMVTVKGDGSYMVNPLKKGPQNGYSDYALHAAGGQGNAGEKSITGITGKEETLETSKISNTAKSIGIKKIFKAAAIPAYLVNDNDELIKTIKSSASGVAGVISDNFASLKVGLSNYVVTAPMGVGAMTSPTLLASGIKDKVLNAALDAADTAAETAMSAFTANTGGVVSNTLKRVPRFATGGINRVITGDAAGKNIFANGAKPELVSSNSDISITPLNKTGTESRSKISRMTQAERNQALATAISSHVIKFSYKLPDGLEELSNVGEAIKVYDVKPGLSDEISVGGTTTTVADMLAGILTALTSLTTNSVTGNQLLTAIAAKPTASNSSVDVGGNPFAGGFTSNLDGILGGN